MFHCLPGFRDFYPAQCAARNYIFDQWEQAALRFNFSRYDVPLLEPLDLFKVKSGNEIVSQLFNFTDKGGREVALRPELTPSLARLVGARSASLKKPVKWFCIGENFRYERPQKGRLRSHYQLNADILGEPGPGADAELIALCLDIFSVFGLTAEDICLRLSDRDLWIDFLTCLGCEGESALQVLAIIDKLERVERKKTIDDLRIHFGDAAEDTLSKIDTLIKIHGLEDLRTFLYEQAPDAEIKDSLTCRLGQWEVLLDRLNGLGLIPWVQIDLGIVRGLAYYTGFVFEVFERSGRSRALAGGGRYDHLLKKLGYSDLPATGFGLGDVVLTDLLEEKKLLPAFKQTPDIYIIMGEEPERKAALGDVARLRSLGFSVEYALKDIAFGKQFKSAGQSGARLALIYGSSELAAGNIKIRDLSSGNETDVPQKTLASVLKKALAKAPEKK